RVASLDRSRQPDAGRLALLRHDRPGEGHHEVHRRLPGVSAVPGRAQVEPVTTRAAVLGSPVAHSLSPVLHRAAYTHLGLTGWQYDAHEVEDARLAGLLH